MCVSSLVHLYFDLDFIPIVREQYFFACELKTLGEPSMDSARTIMMSDAFKATMNGMAGYDGTLSGSVLKLTEV